MRAFRRSLHYFEQVARVQSVRAAAETLCVAPSAVSRAVQQLEGEIGASLFDRSARGLQLTVAGETVLAYMQRWDKEAVQMADAVRSLSGVRLETIRVAAVEVATYELVPRAIADLRARLPGLRVDIKVGDIDLVLESMLNGFADIGLVINLPRNAPVRLLWSTANPVGLVVPKGHRLARRAAVHIAECLDEPLVLPEEPLAARAAIRTALAAAGVYRTSATSNRIVTLKALLRAGLGASFLTRLDVMAEVRDGEFCFIPLDDRNVEHPFISVVVPKGGNRTPTIDALIETLRKAMPSGEFRA